MRKYFDFLEGTDSRAVKGASVRVLNYPSNTNATLFADSDGLAVKTNPVTTDGTGYFEFYVADGHYTLEITGASISDETVTDIVIYDPTNVLANAQNAATQSGIATAQAGIATTQAGIATTQAGIASSGAASSTANATAADLSRQGASAASATAGAYPNSAGSNVPRGLTQASVGAITAGAGGTNGTFALAFSGGTGWLAYPTGTFTVAGGALTAVAITGPGLNINSAPVVPTVSFAASAGLAGAAVALTMQFLVTAGQGYWVTSADALTLDRYQNVAGVATRDLTTASISSAIGNQGPLALNKALVSDAGSLNWLLSKPFSTADKGVVFDIAAPNTVYQDTAGATPITTSGQSVARLQLTYPGDSSFANLLGNSVKDIGTGWTQTRITPSLNANTGPDSDGTADGMVPTAVAGTHGLSITLTKVVGVTYRMRAAIAPNGYTKARLAITATEFADINFSTGAIIGTSAGVTNVTVTAKANGYFEAFCDFVATSTSETASLLVLDAASAVSFTGDGVSGVFYGYCYIEKRAREHFLQATGTKAPLYIEENGTKMLRFDGVDDFMQALDMDFSTCSKLTIVLALRQYIFSSGANILLEHGVNSVTSGGFGAILDNGTTGAVGGTMSTSAGNARANNGPTQIGVARKAVLTITLDPNAATDADKVSLRVSGEDITETVAVTSGTVTTAGAFATRNLFMGSRIGTSLFTNFDLYAGFIIGRALTATELLGIEGAMQLRLGREYSFKPKQFSDCGPTTDQTQFIQTNPFATVEVMTQATSMDVSLHTNLFTSFPALTAVGVYVDGVYNQSINPTGTGQQTFTITLPAGDKLVSVVNGPQALVTGTVMGTWVTRLSANRPMTQVFVPRRRIVGYGDSIAVGEDASPVMQFAYLLQLRSAGWPMSVTLEGHGSRSLFDDANTATLRKAFVKKLLQYKPDAVMLLIGTNDFGLNKWSAANFGTAYAAVLDDLHSFNPGMRIYCQTMFPRSSEIANSFGDTLTAYRTQISTAVSTRTSFCTLVDGTAILVLGDLSDGLHPSTAGHTKVSDYWKANVFNW